MLLNNQYQRINFKPVSQPLLYRKRSSVLKDSGNQQLQLSNCLLK